MYTYKEGHSQSFSKKVPHSKYIVPWEPNSNLFALCPILGEDSWQKREIYVKLKNVSKRRGESMRALHTNKMDREVLPKGGQTQSNFLAKV